ncbi:MAG: hypothetical protein CMC93_00545 [Flavobacteriaceae bacterium]|nr:hypothetical protein [Flavobacteriaceae bacterium]|tara:strand:+ start:632 stop:862 length:231 start_codon:yes stop_codon:yes gene_type:complete
MSVFFLYCNTEFYQSQQEILGVYKTFNECTDRLFSLEYDMKDMETGVMGNFWRTKDHQYRFYIREYPMGDCSGIYK